MHTNNNMGHWEVIYGRQNLLQIPDVFTESYPTLPKR
jgi:hypothetical protein